MESSSKITNNTFLNCGIGCGQYSYSEITNNLLNNGTISAGGASSNPNIINNTINSQTTGINCGTGSKPYIKKQYD